ncbi:MAG TPA: sugar ABC transporter ATP-binding protein, partial [Fimbriimonadaceae bacterium]|nr:sugar ABC transporter ATP-binding protein [Fimbriimonadaceae bacterium]
MPLLEMSHVSKSFPGVLALDDVSFSIEKGEVRALMGENGAGKSTLIKVLTGVHQPDAGALTLGGEEIRPTSPVHAQSLGVSTVYQEVNLVPNLSVAENVCLGSETRRFGKIDWRAMRERARKSVARMNVDIDVSRSLDEFSTAVQQLVAIARAVDRDAQVLVLDEPTSSLDQEEVGQLFDLVRLLRDQGMAIVFVTHFIDQVYSIADSVTVLRNGKKVGDWKIADLPRQRLVAQMLGRELEEVPHVAHEARAQKEPLIELSALGRKRTMEPVSFSVDKGETVGLSGLLGSGRTETMKLIFGATPADSGTVTEGGESFRPKRPRDAIRRDIGFCPEDRKAEGVCPGLSVTDNLLLVLQARRGWLRKIPRKEAERAVAEHVQRLQIKLADPARPIDSLSGGNQQKVLLSRWLAAQPKLLLLDEPTRGID